MSERFGNYADKFGGVSLGSRWSAFVGSPTLTGGAIVEAADFDMSAGAADPSPSHTTGDFTGKYIQTEMLISPNYGYWFYLSKFPFDEYFGFDIYGGNIEFSYRNTPAGIVSMPFSEPYDTAVHKALRIREDDGTLYAEYWNGYAWVLVHSMASPSWITVSIADSQGGYVNGVPGMGEAVTVYGYNIMDPSISETIDFWCPASASDPESSDPGDLGDFEEPITPPYTSQKNIVDISYDPRSGTLLRTQGGFGAFNETPPTSTKISTSVDCGRTWSAGINFADFIEGSYNDPPFSVFSILDFFHVPVSIIPGANVGEWILFDFVGGYYISTDNGLTWGTRQMSGITPVQNNVPFAHADYYGLVGVNGAFNTRMVNPHHYLDLPVPQIGYSFTIEVPFRPGIRRSIGANGVSGWENSLDPTDQASGGSGWDAGDTPPVLYGANGRWIACVGWQETQSEDDTTFDDVIVPAMRINTSSDLDPGSWEAPFWPVSEAWVTDMYGGFKTGGSYGATYLNFEFGAGRLKFIPMDNHPAGGRWWLMGMQDSLIYSDDNGVTWSNSLADHTAPEDAMHPILNWRASHALGYRYTPSKILDIMADPLDSGRLIAIGVTYDRAGISNRLAVFCCSTDGGDSWGPVGQLAIRLSNITSVGIGADFDSPATARHGFPCLEGQVA